MPKVYGSYKNGADIYKDPKSKKFYILEWNPQIHESYKKFISFKPTAPDSGLTNQKRPTIKMSRKHKRLTTKKTQKGGQPQVPGKLQLGECEAQVLTTDSYKSILEQLRLSDAINKYLGSDIQKIRDEYNDKFADKRLVDVIYNLPGQGIKPVLGQLINQKPNMCWDHGFGNHTSITGGVPGIHVYIANMSMGKAYGPKWQLVGVFIRN